MSWDGFFNAVGKTFEVVGEAALIKNAQDTIALWTQFDPEEMKEGISDQVFAMSGEQLRRVDSTLRRLIKMKAFDPSFDSLLSVYAHFHGAWTLRLHLARGRG